MDERIDDGAVRRDDPADRRANEQRALLMQALDGCRAGHDETPAGFPPEARQLLLDDPQTAEWLQRTRAFDAAVTKAFAAVPVPPDLAARVAAALAEEESNAVPASAASSVSSPSPPLQVFSSRPRSTRRRWLAGAGSALAASAVGGAFFVWWKGRSPRELSVDQVLEEGLTFHQQAATHRGAAKPISELRPPPALPLSRFVSLHGEPRVRVFQEPLLGRFGVVYELAPRDQPRAALYVVADRAGLQSPSVPLLAAEPMPHPFITGGCAMSVWREEDRIVLLVVDGDARRYREFLSAPRSFV